MSDPARRYRKKPLAVFEHGTRLYAPSHGEGCYRVVATDTGGKRLFHKFSREEAARAKARELESYLASNTPIHGCGDRSVAALATAYLTHLEGRSRRYQERQEAVLRCWVLPRLAGTPVSDWSPAMSEEVLGAARRRLAPQTVQSLGSCMRSLVTFAHKSRWLPREVDPMWLVSYSIKGDFQGEAAGFVPRDLLPNESQCSALFDALDQMGQPAWSLAMKLKHRSGVRWGELIALRPVDIEFEPHRVVKVHRAIEQSSRGRAIKSTKNKQRRTSLFPASLGNALSEHVETVRRLQGDEALLFSRPDGEPAERRQFLRLWTRAARMADWPMRSRTVAKWHPHDLRHVAACWMLFDVGIDAAVASRMLGHANPAFTLSRYVGVREGAAALTNALTADW